jgi:hypothetical protein
VPKEDVFNHWSHRLEVGMTAKVCAYAFLLLTASASAAPCYSDGDVVTLEGTATRQASRQAASQAASPAASQSQTEAPPAKPAWVLSLASPICVDAPAAAQGQRQQSTVTVVQIIDAVPAENARIQLTGKLVTGNVSEYYAVPTAIFVLRQRVLSGQ